MEPLFVALLLDILLPLRRIKVSIAGTALRALARRDFITNCGRCGPSRALRSRLASYAPGALLYACGQALPN